MKKFTGKTRLFLCIAGAIIAVALVMQIAGVGLNLGIDFTGGSLLSYSVGEDYDVADVETILNAAGYEGSQITKAAPSDASIALQAEIAKAAEEAAKEEPAEEPAEETAEEEAAEESAEETAEDTAEVPEDVIGSADGETEIEITETEEPLLNPDKSGIKADGLTDLQLRLRLVDETEGLEDAVDAAVKASFADAEKLGWTELTNSIIVNRSFEGVYAGGFAAEYEIGAEFDSAEILPKIREALEGADFSVAELSVTRFDAAAEAEAEAAAAEEEPVEEEPIEEETAEEEPAEEEAVQETGTSLRVLVKIDDQASQVRDLIERNMVAKYPNFRFVSIDHVSAVAGHDLLSNALKALLIAFAGMLVYIAIRFDVFSGLAALFGLAHDILIMCSFMVFFRGLYQVNSSFIAAILTIVGYSINNTIIIFDRIRETAKKPGWTEKPRIEIVENSVAHTLSRTINTSLTTLITLVALYIFGVESIREFAFPLIVGMLAGTYSSVLLSGQVWAYWMDKRAAKKTGKKA